MDELEAKLEYRFHDRALLLTALSHSSYANENKGAGFMSNERLEFLGDSVLGQVVASHLYLSCPKMPEGQMTRLRAELVCETSLYEVAKLLNLGKFIKLGRGEEHTGGRARESILADAVEALIAALYLDGGLAVAKSFIDKYILSKLPAMETRPISDYKTALQEYVQRKTGQILSYELLTEEGPDHNKSFTMQVSLNGKPIGEGNGHTKKEAEQCAAKNGIEEISK
ncbi:MAG: ribonuclease III [Firmicutes bacterium HGW-Firmicutes-16]|nr:MAG: ribonuclease III [Firmicutes bacterium HGW-Firmicutes-16]